MSCWYFFPLLGGCVMLSHCMISDSNCRRRVDKIRSQSRTRMYSGRNIPTISGSTVWTHQHSPISIYVGVSSDLRHLAIFLQTLLTQHPVCDRLAVSAITISSPSFSHFFISAAFSGSPMVKRRACVSRLQGNTWRLFPGQRFDTLTVTGT